MSINSLLGKTLVLCVRWVPGLLGDEGSSFGVDSIEEPDGQLTLTTA